MLLLYFFILLINDRICYSQSNIIVERNVKFLLGFQFKRGNRTPPNSLCIILLGRKHGSERNTFSHGKQTTPTNLSVGKDPCPSATIRNFFPCLDYCQIQYLFLYVKKNNQIICKNIWNNDCKKLGPSLLNVRRNKQPYYY